MIAEVTARRRTAQAQLTEIDERQREGVERPTQTDHNAVAPLLGRPVSAARSGIHQGPALEARRKEAEETVAAADRQLAIRAQEREQAALAAKRRVAQAIEAVAGPVLADLIPATEKAFALNEKLERIATISRPVHGWFDRGAGRRVRLRREHSGTRSRDARTTREPCGRWRTGGAPVGTPKPQGQLTRTSISRRYRKLTIRSPN